MCRAGGGRGADHEACVRLCEVHRGRVEVCALVEGGEYYANTYHRASLRDETLAGAWWGGGAVEASTGKGAYGAVDGETHWVGEFAMPGEVIRGPRGGCGEYRAVLVLRCGGGRVR